MSNIYSRSSWNAQYRNGVGTRPTGRLEKYGHHTVTAHLTQNATVAQEKAQMRIIERIGQQRFGGGISYSFIIFPSGRIYEGASVNRIAYHSGSGRNTRGAGICFAGNYDTNKVGKKALEAVVWLLQEGVRRGWWGDPALTSMHRDFSSTACPGRYLYAEFDNINSQGRGGEAKPAPAPSKPKPKPSGNYTGSSVVEYLNRQGQNSSYAARARLAAQYGIRNYRGTAAQNTTLLNALRGGRKPSSGGSSSSGGGSSKYTGSSVVDYLASVNQPTSFAHRARLARQHGINNYTGSASQNTRLLRALRGGSSSSRTARKSVATVANEIINGRGGWGNNPGRARKLRAAGYNPNTVQAEVNRRLR